MASHPPSSVGKFAALGWLYLVQGIPYGLQDKFVPLQLRARGLDYSSVSAVKAVLVPWVTKGVWAPALQLYGDRRRWLLAALLLLTAASFAGSWCDVSDGLPQVVAVLLLLNVGCAVQDVVVDGLAMLWLQHSQLGLVNSMQVVLYKVGSLCGGGGLMLLLSVSSWRTCLLLLSAVYATTALWVMVLPLQSARKEGAEGSYNAKDEVLGSNETPSSLSAAESSNIIKQEDNVHTVKRNKNLSSSTCRSQYTESRVSENITEGATVADSVSSILRIVFCAGGSRWLGLYVLLYKMAERGALNNFPLFLLDKGLSMSELSFWNGLMSQILSIAGSIYGGVVLSKPSVSCSLLLLSHSIQRFLLTVLQSYCVHKGSTSSYIEIGSLNYYLCLMSLCYFSFSTGVISTLTFTLMMRYSKRLPEDLQSSHYSVFASIEVAGKLAFATVAGALVDLLGIQSAFAVFTILSAVPVMLLAFEPEYKSAKATQ